MQPNGPYVPPQQQPEFSPQQPNPYGFINSAGTSRPNPFQNISPAGRFLIIAAGAILLFIFIFMLGRAIFGGPDPVAQQYVSVAQHQTEIITVAKAGTQKANGEATKVLAYSTQLSVQSDQQQLLAYLEKHGVKVKDKQLTQTHDPATDAALAAAEQSGTFDTVFTTTLQKELAAYQQSLRQAYKLSAGGKTISGLLQTDFNNAALLLKQAGP